MSLEISNRLKHGGKDELPAATHEGTGLGLANVCQRLEARWGNVPAAGRADVRRWIQGGVDDAGRYPCLSEPLRVLIADDEPLAAERLQLLLARADGAQLVGTASDGDSAIDLTDALHPDLLLLDIAMPGLDGIGVARALAAQNPSPAVVFVTAFDQFAVAAFEVEAVDYLMKPVEPEGCSGRSTALTPICSSAARSRRRARRRNGSTNSGRRTCRALCGSRRAMSTGCRPSAITCAYTSAGAAG